MFFYSFKGCEVDPDDIEANLAQRRLAFPFSVGYVIGVYIYDFVWRFILIVIVDHVLDGYDESGALTHDQAFDSRLRCPSGAIHLLGSFFIF